jgi:hypothetical protein
MGPAAEYNCEALWYLCTDCQLKRQVDDAVTHLGDLSLVAEVQCYRTAMEVVSKLEVGSRGSKMTSSSIMTTHDTQLGTLAKHMW